MGLPAGSAVPGPASSGAEAALSAEATAREGGSETPRRAVAAGPTSGAAAERGVASLQAALAAKDKKLSALRAAIVSLRQQFEEAELRHEQERRRDAARGNSGGMGGVGAAGSDGEAAQVAELRGKLDQMQRALQQATVAAEGEVVKARRAAERLKAERGRLREEREALDRRVGQLESEVAALQDAVAAAKAEADRQRNRADRLVRSTNKLSGGAASAGGGGGAGTTTPPRGSSGGGDREALRVEIDKLTAQNAALRSALEEQRRREPDGGRTRAWAATEPASLLATALPSALPSASTPASSERGGGPGLGERGTLERARAAERQAKKLAERFATQGQKLSDAEAEGKSLKQRVEALLRSKAELEKKLAGATREAARLRGGGVEGLGDLEATRARVFTLEEENAGLRRRAEVELAGEVRRLQLQLASAEAAAHVSSQRSAVASGGQRGGGGAFPGAGRSMRESEDAFLRLERLGDECEKLRQEKRALELQVLGNDASGLELQFDLGLKAQEVDRLRRRCRELEAANAMMGGAPSRDTTAPGTAASGAGGERAAGQRFARERDLEGVVDGLQRVVHKLKAENERLRAGAGEQVRPPDLALCSVWR